MNEELYDQGLLSNRCEQRVGDMVNHLEIYQHYVPEMHMGIQRSPFRLELKSASFSLFNSDRGGVKWKDHGQGEMGDVYEFVVKWYKVHKDQVYHLNDINRVIKNDLKLDPGFVMKHDLLFSGNEMGPTVSPKSRERAKIQVRDDGWTSWAYDYWINRYQICPSILNMYNVGHAKEVWITTNRKATFLWGVSIPENPIYYFYFPMTEHVKCYRPMAKSKKDRWISNCDNHTDIQGYHQLNIKIRKPKLIIATKAMKEIMFYRAFHIDAIAIHGENHIFQPDFIRHLHKYSDEILGVYDNDRPGKHSSWELRKKYNIPVTFITEAKNITDLWEKDPKLTLKYIQMLKEAYDL